MKATGHLSKLRCRLRMPQQVVACQRCNNRRSCGRKGDAPRLDAATIYRPEAGCAILPRGAFSMLKVLRINNIALMTSLELELSEGLDPADRGNRSRQVHPDRRSGPASGRPRLGRADPHGRGARGGRGRIRGAVAPRPPSKATASRSRTSEVVIRREVLASGKGRPRSTARSCPSGSSRTWARTWPSSTASTSRRACSIRPPTSSCSTPTWGSRGCASAVAAAYRRLAARPRRPSRPCERDRREGERRREMLEFQAAEIEKAALQAGEEEALRREKALQANAGRLADPLRRGLRAPLRRRGRGASRASARSTAGRGAGRDRPGLRRRISRPGPRSGPSSRTWPSSCATTRSGIA